MRTQPGSPVQFRPTRASIDLAAFERNVRTILRHTGTRLMGVIKADAYGHGALPCARSLEKAGADYVGVALAEEALELRRGGIEIPILMLGRVPERAIADLLQHAVTCTLTCAEDIKAVQHTASALGRTAKVHVKIDTGMSRLGIQPEDAPAFWDALGACPDILVEGVFTHFAAADADDLTFTRSQSEAFASVLAMLAGRGRKPLLAHASASSGLHNAPGAWHDMVRTGINLYGGTCPHCNAFSVEPVMRLETSVLTINHFDAGRAVSYGNTYICSGPRRIAVLPLGYADGLPRALSNTGCALIAGRRAPVVGRVCMDMTMVDITDIPGAEEGSPAILFGNPARDGTFCPTVNEIASLTDTIPYTVLCGVSKRVPRVYTE